jgi:aspartate aminotransferase
LNFSGLTESYKADSFLEKINLGVGAYRTDEGQPLVLKSVAEAEQRIMTRKLDKE